MVAGDGHTGQALDAGPVPIGNGGFEMLGGGTTGTLDTGTLGTGTGTLLEITIGVTG